MNNAKIEIEDEFIDIIKSFSSFIESVVNDLENTEAKNDKKRIKKGRNPRNLYLNATSKVTLMKAALLNLLSSERLMKYYVLLVRPLKKWISNRNIKFFLKTDAIFPGAPKEDIEFFRTLWTNNRAGFNDQEKENCWEYFDRLISLVDEWVETTGWTEPDEDEESFIAEPLTQEELLELEDI